MWEIVFIHGGDRGLKSATEVLEAAKLPFRARGWASDTERVRPQIQIPTQHVDAALCAFDSGNVSRVYVKGQFSRASLT